MFLSLMRDAGVWPSAVRSGLDCLRSGSLKISAVATALVAAFCVLLTSPAVAAFSTKAKTAILMDADTGAILYQKNMHKLFPPASMSKLMTLAVVFRALKEDRLSLDDEFLVSEYAWRNGGAPSGTSAMFVPINTKATLSDLLRGIIVQSGNDACMAIAEGMAGTEAAFAEVLQKEARRIGLKKSTFRNSTGLPAEGQAMTAYELAILARHIIKEYPSYYKMFSEERFNYRKHRFINRNPLLFAGAGADGLKTGYTKESGYGIVASGVNDEGRRLIAVLSGLGSKKERRSEGVKFLQWGYRNFADKKIFDDGETVGSARVWGGESFYVPLVGEGDVKVLLSRFPEKQRLKGEIVYMSPLKPPIKKGDQVAHLRVTSSTNTVNKIPLYAAEDVDEGSVVRQGLDSLLFLAFRWIAEQTKELVEDNT